MSNDKSIKETLDVIRRALEDEDSIDLKEDLLILNQKVNDDGTINIKVIIHGMVADVCRIDLGIERSKNCLLGNIFSRVSGYKPVAVIGNNHKVMFWNRFIKE